MAGAERRSQLLRVGRELFAEQGYAATSLDAIAKRAGVTKPVIYQHFENKADLFGSIVDDGVQELARRLRPAFALGTIDEVFEAGARAFMEFLRDDPQGFETLSSNSPLALAVERSRRRIVQVALSRRLHELIDGADDWAIEAVSYATIGLAIYYGQWWANSKSVAFDDAVRGLASMFQGQLSILELAPQRP